MGRYPLGKPWMETPDGMYEIAERFPPLRERVSGWSLNRLLYEYGRPLINDWLVGTTERDRIILAELLRRDLAVYQLRQLLDRTPTNGNLGGAQKSRMYEGGMVTGVVVSAGKSKKFETVLREEIVTARRNPNYVLGNMLASLLPATDVDVSDLAVECVGLEQYSSMQALRYLEARAHTVSIYNALRERIVPKELFADKQRVLATIQKRLQ